MARAGLQGFAVLHHGLDGVGIDRPGEPLAGGLLPLDDRHGHEVLGEVGIDAEHFHRLFAGLLRGRVGGVPLLPEELRRPQEQPRPQFPADDVGPLVDENRQVAVRLHPLRVHRPDNRLARRPHNQRLIEQGGGIGLQFAVRPRLQAVMRDDRTFLGEPLHMVRLLLQKTERDEQRKIGVLMPRRLEHPVQHPLHVLPDRPAPRLDHHAPPHRRHLRQIRRLDDLLVPFGIIVGTSGSDCGFGHGKSRVQRVVAWRVSKLQPGILRTKAAAREGGHRESYN